MELTIGALFRIGQARELFRIMIGGFMKSGKNENGRRIIKTILFKHM
jgi:hypothetical protein